jgi:parallel beta-helix repeat protein
MEMGANRNRIEGNVVAGGVRYGVLVSDPGNSYNVIVGNRIGTDATGTRAFPNGLGVYVGFMGASFNRIGGTNPGEGNLVSGNDAGVSVEGAGTAGNLVLGNWIGTDVSGAKSLPNYWGGLHLGVGGRVLAGGADAAGRNVVSGNSRSANWGWGVRVEGAHHYLAGNYVGIDATGSGALANGGAGVWLRFSENSFIQGNVIAHNTEGGVVVESYASNTLRRNSIYGHSVGGIRLLGGNESLAAPVITAVNPTSVSGIACPGCTVEFFSDAEDEGRFYEGATVADDSGRFELRKPSRLTGPYITATATDREGNTSEFSQPVRLWRYRLWLPVFWKIG